MKKHYILLASLLTLQAYSQTAYNSYDLLTQGIELTKQGNYIDAIKNFNEINISDANYLNAQYELITSYLSTNELEKSLQLSTQLYNEKKYLEEPQLLSLHGIVLSTNDKLADALAVFEMAEKQFPESTHILFNKAVVYQKQNNKQAALDLYKKIIEIDPSHTSALFNLGLIALEDGKIVHGSFALMTYLMVEPLGNNSKSALMMLNKKYNQNYNIKPSLNYNEKQSFKELEQLLMAQVQFHKNFNLKVSIDDVVFRNMQMILDYLETHDLKENDFYETKFASHLKKIAMKQQTANYLYTSGLSVADALEKDLNKNKKEIEGYIENYLKPDILPAYFSVHKNNATYRIFREGYEKGYVQVKPNDLNFREGKAYSENITGYKTADSNFKNDLLNGIKIYYSANGNITSEENYKDDKLHGLNKEYYTTKNIKGEFNYADGNLNGAYKTYFPCKNVNCLGEYSNNEYNGTSECFFANGVKRLTATYANGKFNGLYENYNEIGNLVFKANYVNNEINGEITEYYSDKTLKRSGTYINGKPVTDIYYFYNGKPESEYIFTDGKISTTTNYRQDGSILNKILYDSKERKLEHHDYNRKNEIYQKDYYKNGNFSKSEYFLPNVETVAPANRKQTNYNAIGKIISDGNFAKEVFVGEWNYYSALGNLKSKFFYDDSGNLLKAEGYNAGGGLTYKVHYKDNNYYGAYEQFLNNKLIQVNNYNEKGLNGPEIIYYPTGTIRSNSFYIDGYLSNNKYVYTLDNQLALTQHFINNILISTTTHLTEKPEVFSFADKTGTLETKLTPATTVKHQLKNGVKNGETITSTKNMILAKENYVNDNMHGKQEHFNLFGKKIIDLTFVNGLKHGKQSWYDELGTLESSGNYTLGETFGIFNHYYYNQKPYTSITVEQDVKHGAHTYFDFNGNKIGEVIYYEGTPVKYTTFTKEGSEITKDITNGTFDLISYYKNGNKSLEINFKNYDYHGVYKIFFENGKPAIEMEYTNGYQNNYETTYYANGSVYSKKNYNNDLLTKTSSYYYENGDKALDIDYSYDLLHGNYTIYENNKVKTTAKYNSDFLVEI